MADNQFSVRVPNINEGFASGEDGYSTIARLMKGREVEGARRDVAAAFQSGDPNATRGALARLMSVDPASAAQIAHMTNNDRDFQFRQQEATRGQSNADRSFGLQQQTANTAQIVTAEDASGNKTPIRVDRHGTATAINVPGVTSGGQPGNPYAYGKQTETQSKDSGYANRMFRAESVLRDPEVEKAAISLWENTKGMAPGFVSNYLTSPDYQKFDQAKRDFVNAVLRRESGAAISQSEFDNAHKQYFAQPGDTPERIAEKKKNRQDAIAGVAGGGGQHYRPPFTFDQAGAMVPTGNPKQGVPAQQAVAPPEPAVVALKSDPKLRAQFDAKYGVGASKGVLGW